MIRLLPAIAILLLAACTKGPPPTPAPARVETAPPVAKEPSRVDIPVTLRIAMLQAALEREVPRQLWTIDEVEPRCIPAQRIGKLKVIPDLSCRIRGGATRGAISVGGSGRTLTLSMPVSIRVAAENVGGIVKRQDATAAARVRMTARLGLSPDWQPTARVDIDYSWTQIPGITVLGQRIKFGRKVDPKLRALIPGLERQIAREVARLDVKREAQAAWNEGFAVLSLNRKNPPVWLRVTPEHVHFGGYRIAGKDIALDLGLTALTETFVGPEPEKPAQTPLPRLRFDAARPGATLNVPVIASYAELEPVLKKALGKLSAKGVMVPKLGRAQVKFGDVTIYGTSGNRIAVGIDLEATSPNGLLNPKGRVWLTGLPVNEPGSRVVRIRDLAISGNTDSPATNFLASVVLSVETIDALAGGLTENFEKDFLEVLGKANAALKARQEGALAISAALTEVRNGRITAYGQGLYMPVFAKGTASIRFVPKAAR